MKKTTKSTSKTPLRPPAWLVKYVERQSRLERPTSTNASPDFQRGEKLGQDLRAMYDAVDQRIESAELTHRQKLVNTLLRQCGEGLAHVSLDRDAQVEFLRGVLAGVTNAIPVRGDELTDQINNIVFNRWNSLATCRTRREIVDMVKAHLPQKNVNRWSLEQHAAFAKRIEQLCRRIGFSPARRGRPASK